MKVNYMILAIGFSMLINASSAFAGSGSPIGAIASRWPRACGWITDHVASACGGNKPCDCDAACDAYEEICHNDDHDTFSEGTWMTACQGRKDCNGGVPVVPAPVGPAVGKDAGASTATW